MSVEQRILEAAGAVFAERGFEGTTIRQITERAGVNVAAVNYYFSDKEGLYARVLAQACVASQIDIDELPGKPSARLASFIDRFVHYLLQPGRPAWHGRVMALEMSNPTPALDQMARESIEPLCRSLQQLLKELVGPSFTPIDVELFSASILGQCLYYAHKGPLIDRVYPHLRRAPDRATRIATHICEFTLAGLAGLRKQKTYERKS